MAVCKKVISAMDEYCVKFKKDGVTRDEMSDTLDSVRANISSLIPDSDEYKDDEGNVDFDKYFESLKSESIDEDKTNSNGIDALFMDIYPFLSTVPVEIEKTYR